MGFGDYLTQTFPNVRITSSKRDPNSRLGRANPKSFHNVGMAWDVAPIPGMTFDQYKARVAQDGWNVREAIDEVKNPSRHATGPHWHMAVDGRKEQQPMAGNGLAALMQGIYPMAQQEQQGMAQPQGLASLLPLDTPLQKAVMPGDQPAMPQMEGLPGVKPKGRGTANDILGSIFDALAAAGGGTPTYWSSVLEQQQLETEGRQRLAERQAIREEKLADAMRPRVEQVGNQIGMIDPRTGAFTPTYAAPRENEFLSAIGDWQELSTEQQAAYGNMLDIKSPIAVSGPTGVARVPRTYGMPQASGSGNLRAEAEAAIAAGANPETVWARYRQMGGQ